MTSEAFDVVIAGGGLAGLSASAFLATHGVSSLLVEKHRGLSIHPRARGLNPRAMELLRSLRLDRQLMAAAAGFAGFVTRAQVESLAGRELNSVTLPTPARLRDISPAQWCLCSQDRAEPFLRAKAESLGASMRFGVELMDFEQDSDGVVARIRDRDSGAEQPVHARYLIAADGARGTIRERLGIGLTGPGVLAHQMSILFRADLRPYLRDRRFAVCQIQNQDVRGILAHDDTLQVGTLIVRFQPEAGQQPADFTDERCQSLIRAAVGDPDLHTELLAVLPWEMAATSADRYLDGRVLLIGDAAHVLPPAGGFGASAGMQDAHNLAWKIASVLRGTAGPSLLTTYDTERRPIGELTMRQSHLRIASGTGVTVRAAPAELLDELTLTFGYGYRSPAICLEDDSDPSAPVDPRTLSGIPGTRAPHLELNDGVDQMSTLDLFGPGLVLLTGKDGEQWLHTAAAVTRRLGVPIDVHLIGRELTDVTGAWDQAYGVGGDGAVLVRPDGFVAWRTAQPGAGRSAEVALAGAINHVLCRGQETT